MKGKIFAIAGYSGVGKGTVVKYLVKDPELNVVVSVSCTTREKRKLSDGVFEVDGKDYFFISHDEFLKKIDENAFAEYDEHHGEYYGTLVSYLEENTSKGINVIVEIDVNGVQNLKNKGLCDSSIFISAPLEVVRQRLINRNTETMEQIEKRMSRCEYEKSKIYLFDHEVENIEGHIDETVAKIKSIMLDCINSQE